MTEIAQLFESALRQNRANLLRKAAINTVAKMPAATTLHELLSSEAGSSIRELTLVELREALAGFVTASTSTSNGTATSRRIPANPSSASAATSASSNGTSPGLSPSSSPGSSPNSSETPESREARLYRQIIEACGTEPKTIGQLAKVVEVDVVELRGYLAWMKKMGKIDSSGRARATRYHLPQGS
ncbi:MAG: hypothetical protein H0T76_23125 [Nannocystis sp.]|nr:hypothetical protein [Nannocystis sp.]MBA3549377.1 hypothetical protein [Nannocystis sp.]